LSLEQLQLAARALRRYRRQCILVLLTITVDTAFTIAFYYGIKLLIDAAVAGRDQTTTVRLVMGLGALYVVTTIANAAREYLLTDVEVRLATNLRVSMLGHLQQLALDYHRQARSSDLLARFSTDVTAIKNALTRSLPTLIRYGLQAIAVVVLLFFLEWRLVLIVALALGLTAMAVRILAVRGNRFGPRYTRDQAAVLATVQDQITSHLEVKVFGFRRLALERFRQQLARLATSSAMDSLHQRMITRVIESAAALTQLIVASAGVWLIFQKTLTVGSLTAFIGLLGVLSMALIRFALGLPDWLSSAGALRRVDALLTEQPAVTDALDAIPLPPVATEIRFDRVSFRHAGERFAVRDLSFSIPAGHRVAFVGRNGSGKSTLLSLLLRLWDPQEGSITIGGHDLRAVTQDSLYAQFGVVFQHIGLLDETVGANIRLGRPEATDAEIEAAARRVQVHEAIVALPQGYDTIVSDRGGYLSGGQQQHVSLARALVRNPRVLILDEATAALDPAAEAAFNETLEQLPRARTVIAATHRLMSVVRADHIFVLEGGRLVEHGRHEDLLERGGVYHELWHRQAGFILSKGGREARVTAARLRRIPLFGTLDETHLALLAEQFASETASPGQVLIAEGTVGHTFYLIVRGTMEVVRLQDGEEQQIDSLQDGDYFGEIALLAQVPRTATVRAHTPSLLLTLTRDQFNGLMSAAPEVRRMMDQVVRERLSNLEASSG
jgi:ATP-binding cassette subfamily B protein